MPRQLSVNGKKPALSRRLSGVDAAFLYLERKEIPLNIAAVCVFDGPIPFDEFVAGMDSKLHLIPRYQQLAVAPPYNLGPPTWEPDPYFDIRRHIFRVRLDSPGGEAQLEALAGRILTQVMDRSKPLWEIYVIDGLKNGRGALLARVHHALADGVSGAALMQVMLDPTPEGSRAIRKPPPRPKVVPPQPTLTEALANTLRGTVENLIAAEAGVMAFTHALLSGRLQKGLEGLASLMPELAASSERLPFNKPCTGDRRFCWVGFDFADVKGIRGVAGGTVNDVILTVVTRALASYVKLHGETVRNRFVRIVCPVNLRQDNGESLGNRITFLPVALPLDVRNPLEALRGVSARMEIMKGARVADMVALIAAWLGAAPPPLQWLFWWGIPQLTLPVPLLNTICTNVPGSPVPLYAAGRRMLECYPHVPTGQELGVNIAVQTYDGRIFFGLTSDTHAAPDAGRLRDFLRTSFEDLCREAGLRKKPPRKKAVRKPRVHKAEPVESAEPATDAAAGPAPEPEPPPAKAPETTPELAASAVAGR